MQKRTDAAVVQSVSSVSMYLQFFSFFLSHLDADMEDYGFEYSEEEPEEQDVDIENQYYNSKGTESPSILTVHIDLDSHLHIDCYSYPYQ